jgi:hypothetical protein
MGAKMASRFSAVFVIAVLTLVLVASDGAKADLITNGGFELTNNGPNKVLTGSWTNSTNPTGWTVGTPPSITFSYLYGPGGADATGASPTGGFPNTTPIFLWGPNNPAPGGNSNNGLPAASPAGGNFLALDSDGPAFASPISQTITGLTPGAQYDLGFWTANAQFRDGNGANFSGPSTGQLEASLGPDNQFSPLLPIASHGFSGWQHVDLIFTARSNSELLTFLATSGTPGLPPAALLDGVTLNQVTAVPEPTSLWFTALGLLGLGVVYLRQRRARLAAA